MPTKNVNDNRLYKILTNLLLWFCFGAVILVVHAYRSNASPTTPVPAEIITHFIDLKLYFSQLGAFWMLYTFISVITHKAADNAEFKRGRYFIELLFDECGAILINFGSLLIIACYFSSNPIYLLGSLVNYAVGYYISPKR